MFRARSFAKPISIDALSCRRFEVPAPPERQDDPSPISIMSAPERQARAPEARRRLLPLADRRAPLLPAPAASRALSMNSLAVGLSVRFLSVVTATGCTEGGSVQGNTASRLGAAP